VIGDPAGIIGVIEKAALPFGDMGVGGFKNLIVCGHIVLL
jgi:hypothetical protein